MLLYRGQSTMRAEGAAKGTPARTMGPLLAQAIDGMTQASGRWFTDDLAIARWYAGDVPGNCEIVCVEISDYVADAFRVSNLEKPLSCGCDPLRFSRDPEREFMLPRHVADRAVAITTLGHRMAA